MRQFTLVIREGDVEKYGDKRFQYVIVGDENCGTESTCHSVSLEQIFNSLREKIANREKY